MECILNISLKNLKTFTVFGMVTKVNAMVNAAVAVDGPPGLVALAQLAAPRAGRAGTKGHVTVDDGLEIAIGSAVTTVPAASVVAAGLGEDGMALVIVIAGEAKVRSFNPMSYICLYNLFHRSHVISHVMLSPDPRPTAPRSSKPSLCLLSLQRRRVSCSGRWRRRAA